MNTLAVLWAWMSFLAFGPYEPVETSPPPGVHAVSTDTSNDTPIAPAPSPKKGDDDNIYVGF